MASVRPAGPGFSPLDEELGLLSGSLTPRMQEAVDRLGTWIPFRRAAEFLEKLTGARVSESTARRQTLEAGRNGGAAQAQGVAGIERELPGPPAGPEKQV